MIDNYSQISGLPYCYSNQTRQIQIVRVFTGLNQCIERAVFPKEFFTFAAPSHAQLEIHTYSLPTSVLSDRIPCQKLDCNNRNDLVTA